MFAGLLVFCSATQFATLQWNTGVRYMMPILPLLFLAAVPVLATIPRPVTWVLVGVSVLINLAASMFREDVPTSIRLLFAEGPTLPLLLVLKRMASGYNLGLPAGAFWVVTGGVGLALTAVWLPYWRSTRELSSGS